MKVYPGHIDPKGPLPAHLLGMMRVFSDPLRLLNQSDEVTKLLKEPSQ